jgi:hypothetical protein
LYSADLVRKSAAFYPNNNPHADLSACYKWLIDYDFGFVHQVFSYTRVHPGSQTSKSFKLGTLFHSHISDLVQYGHQYLTPKEIEERNAFFTNLYYVWLVPRIYDRWGDKSFWDLQRTSLRNLGLELSRIRLCQAIVPRAIEEMGSPRAVLRKVRGLGTTSKKIDARRYYD